MFRFIILCLGTLVRLVAGSSEFPPRESRATPATLRAEASAFEPKNRSARQVLLGSRPSVLVRMETIADRGFTRDFSRVARAGFRLYWRMISTAMMQVVSGATRRVASSLRSSGLTQTNFSPFLIYVWCTRVYTASHRSEPPHSSKQRQAEFKHSFESDPRMKEVEGDSLPRVPG